MSEKTIVRIIGAALALGLLGFAGWFMALGADANAASLIAVAIGLVGIVMPSPIWHRTDSSSSTKPKRRTPPPLPILILAQILALVIGACAIGCGPGAYVMQYRGATVLSGVHAAAGTVIDDARESALDRVEREHPTDPEHDAELDREAARWRPVSAALDAAREAIGAWIDAIDLARAAGGDPGDLLAPLLALAARAVLLYEQISRLAGALGIDDLPPLPPFLRALATSTVGDRGHEEPSITGGAS